MKVQSAKVKSQSFSVKRKSELKYRAYGFSLAVIKFVSPLPNQRIFWVIIDQLLRAATSVGANIVEAQAASSKKDFIKFYEIALKSASETKYWLCLLRDAGVLADTKKVEELLQEAIELSRILGSSLITLKGKRKL